MGLHGILLAMEFTVWCMQLNITMGKFMQVMMAEDLVVMRVQGSIGLITIFPILIVLLNGMELNGYLLIVFYRHILMMFLQFNMKMIYTSVEIFIMYQP